MYLPSWSAGEERKAVPRAEAEVKFSPRWGNATIICAVMFVAKRVGIDLKVINLSKAYSTKPSNSTTLWDVGLPRAICGVKAVGWSGLR